MNRSRFRIASLGALLALSMLPACVTRGYPTHGGGKRFAHEQAIVTRSIDSALAQIDFSKIAKNLDATSAKDDSVAVQIFSVSHSGGGVQSGGGAFLGGLIGMTPVIGSALQGRSNATPSIPASMHPLTTAGVAAARTGPGSHSSFAFESADDIRYLMGRLVDHIGRQKLRVVTPRDGEPRAVLSIVVSELGIDQSDFSALVYSEKELQARTTIDAFLVSPGKTGEVGYTSLGRGSSAWRFREDFFLGFGPLSGGVPEEMMLEEVTK
ncbi:MAG: hypothetical protein NXI31_03970 [bacterium]|nr:hypothetical protein [bacterium]